MRYINFNIYLSIYLVMFAFATVPKTPLVSSNIRHKW